MSQPAFYTFGCKANQYQTDLLRGQLTEAENTCVINTCTVTVDAARSSLRAIRRALRQGKKVIVCGCLARLEGDKLKKLFPEIEISDIDFQAPGTQRLVPNVRANLMIQDGCENYCSYCIVPHARGKLQSKPIDQVVKEAEALVQAGTKEIVLTGINLGAYQYSLPEVIGRMSLTKGLLRIRLSSIEPMYLTRELIDSVANTPKVCRHLHIPLQSGDNNILKAMNRNYSSGNYLELVGYIRKKMPDCGLTTDVIVGFPGEGEKEFQNTIDLIQQVNFSRLHVFPYSQRRGTPAAIMPGQVDGKIKKARNKVLRDLGKKQMGEFASQYLNQAVEILIEQKGEGLTSNFIRCFFNDPADSSGSLKKICASFITDAGEIRG
ncbi:MAG: MiaB/RimO family radical SAM methylthiotransferase [Candidatus Margulisbacteria bacterium]|nr:MiaB/RimO family radical SAM methylthiotransferase [Candidatus Margulisiibacteriota bacterium]